MDSPLAKALLSKQVDDEVSIEIDGVYDVPDYCRDHLRHPGIKKGLRTEPFS